MPNNSGHQICFSKTTCCNCMPENNKGVRFRGKIIIILLFTQEHAVTSKIVTRDRGGGSQMESVTNVLQGGGVFKMAQICVM